MTRLKLGRMGRWIPSAALVLLAGCQGMYMHNPERAAAAAVAKKNIETVDIDAISKAERENIARLTAEAIKGMEAREKLVSAFELIQITSGEQSVIQHYTRSMTIVVRDLQAESMLELKEVSDCKIKRDQQVNRTVLRKRQLVEAFKVTPPACNAAMPAGMDEPAGLTPAQSARFRITYANYKSLCSVAVPQCRAMDLKGDLEVLEASQADLAKERQKLKDSVDTARREYAEAVKQNKAKTKAAADKDEEVKKKAEKLVDSLDKLAKKAPGLADRIKGSALVELLSAAATGNADTKNGDHAAAMEVAKSLPSLAESVAVAEAADAQVPVSHLLLALNNVLIVGERNDQLAALDDEDIALQKRKIAVLENQADLWRAYSDQLCKLVIIANTALAPSGSCDTIRFGLDNGVPTCEVRIGARKEELIKNCVLARSWRELFGDGLAESMKGASAAQLAAARRALHEAAAAYLQVRLMAYHATLEQFRRFDVAYRRTVVQREAALEQWKNVVALPAGELEAYYNGGVKPAEISDLLVKALGFTAVAVGASK